MDPRYRLSLLLLLLCAPLSGQAQTQGCLLGNAGSILHANNVRARLFNNGGLFWKGDGNLYNVPASSRNTPNAIFTASIWMGGKVNGQIRTAATDYGNWELWPGPLDAEGKPPTDCTPFDRIFAVSQANLDAYNATGALTDDLRDWPWHWGAPVVDGDGNPNNYNLAGGDRPELLGDQTHWWVMNDAAAVHRTTGTPPLGMEVRVSAFGADSEVDAIANTTLYRYRLTYRGTAPLDSAYFGFWIDSDLGNATDDYIGSDTLLDMGFTYNADDFDEGSDGYGQAPPALGTVFLKGLDETHADREMSVFLYYDGITAPNGNPRDRTDDWYKFLKGRWLDGKPMLNCGDGYTRAPACAATARPTTFMWPGDPVTKEFWSEFDFDGAGQRNPPNDRRYLMTTGPFWMQPGQTKDVVIAIVWARGADHLDSITELRNAIPAVKQAWQSGFRNITSVAKPTAPTAPVQLVSPAQQATDQPTRLALRWEPVARARVYDVELRLGGETPRDTTLRIIGDTDVLLALDSLGAIAPGTVVTWRVRARNSSGAAPWSFPGTFTLSGENLVGVESRFANFLTVANSAGPLDPPEYAAFAFNSSGFPHPTTGDRPVGTRQQSAGLSASQGWGIHTFGNRTTFDQWSDRTVFSRGNLDRIGQNDFEWRFTGSSVAERRFDTVGADTMTVPFEIWNVGMSPGPEDDFRLIPFVCESACGAGKVDGVFDIGGDSPLSGNTDDPISDAVYWYEPADTSPGEAGYRAWEAEVTARGSTVASDALVGKEVFGRLVLMGWNFGDGTQPYPLTVPEPGTIFRIETAKFALTPPAPSAPASGAEVNRTAVTLYWQEPIAAPRYAWQQPTEIARYRTVELARDAAFTQIVRRDSVATGGVHAVSGLVPGETYWWRVQLAYQGDEKSPWSAAQRFTVSATATDATPEDSLPTALTLERIWPNPATSRATLRYGLPAATAVRLTLYDVLGREVAHVSDGETAAGWHHVALPLGSLASGVYVVRVAAGGRQATQTLVITR